jgi:hypothetical protein
MMRALSYFALTVAHIALYFTRDFVFVNINYQIKYLSLIPESSYTVFNYTHSIMEPLLTGYSIEQLTTIKWVLTVICVLLFFSLSLLLMLLYLKDKKQAITITSLFYGVFLVLGGLAYLLINYRVSREIMTIPQSPIASLILFTAVRFLKK